MKRTPCQGHRIRSAKLPFQARGGGSARLGRLHAPDASPIGEGNGHPYGLQKLLGSPVRPFSLSGRPPPGPPNTTALQRRLCGLQRIVSSTIGTKG
jgi:hypothetical protein